MGAWPGSRGPQDFICKLRIREIDVFSLHKNINSVWLEVQFSWQNACVSCRTRLQCPAPYKPGRVAGTCNPRKGEEEEVEMNFRIVLNHIVGSTYGLWETPSK